MYKKGIAPIIIILVIAAVVAGVMYILISKNSPLLQKSGSGAGNAVRLEGNLINNPNLKREVWYLVYDKPGARAVTAELVFTATSICQFTVIHDCANLLPTADRVSIEGWQRGDEITVKTLTVIESKKLVDDNSTALTAGWQTYRNKQYGFEFKYPSPWFAKDTSDGAGHAVYEISVYPVDPDKFCEDLLQRSPKGFLCGVSPALQIYKKTNDEKPTFNKNLEFDYGIKVDEQEINQVISTFKFLGTQRGTTLDPKKGCNVDSDCVLFLCSGPFNKEYAKTLPPDLACTEYSGYDVGCVENICTAVIY